MPSKFTSNVRSTPSDWPNRGPIDLAIHDLPHASAGVEWWYINSHLQAGDGGRYSVFAAFFRIDSTPEGATEKVHTHYLTWALVDTDGGRYHPHTLLDQQTPKLALDDLERSAGSADARMTRAFKEIFNRNVLPLPDRLMPAEAVVALDTLALDYGGGNRFSKLPDNSYAIELASPGNETTVQLRFTLDKPVVRHGDDGVVRGLAGHDMFYYFSPRTRVNGHIRLDGRQHVVQGSGWYDHEFGDGDGKGSGNGDAKVAWNWVSAQLDDGSEVCAYDLIDKADHTKGHGRWVVVIDPTGRSRGYDEFAFESHDVWTSTKTFNEYPTRYVLRIPGAGIELDISPVFPEQEVITIISSPAFWEGVVEVSGSVRGKAVSGRGFVERSGFSVSDSTEEFFSSVGRQTRRAIDRLLTDQPTPVQASGLIGGSEHYISGISLDQYSRTVLRPIREIILRGGKAWRSYGMLACMDIVGGDSQRFADWLVVPELLHVGSLIIDDVQDESTVRRGGPACHVAHGVPLAINAGCASYFLAELPLGHKRLPDAVMVRIYAAYFDAIRAAHAGQALDIDGLTSLVPQVVESGDGALLEQRVLGIHRLKSAAPSGALARVAALVAGGTERQAEALGELFEAFGVAFQVIDDVLNLRGFEQDRKSRGEDITAGKVTAPVAKAMALLDLKDRRRLWELVASKPSDPRLIGEAVRLVDSCGALAQCEAQAREIVENAWRALDPLVPDSVYKVRMRTFGWFLLDRHY